MEELFNDMQRQIATQLGDAVSLIDEDYGQLEALMNLVKTITPSPSPVCW